MRCKLNKLFTVGIWLYLQQQFRLTKASTEGTEDADFSSSTNEGHVCLHHGTCITVDYEGDMEFDYCHCTAHYTGVRCETHVVCENYDLCENGSTCQAMPKMENDGRRVLSSVSSVRSVRHNLDEDAERMLIEWSNYLAYEPYCDCSTANGMYGGKYCNEENATPSPIVVSTAAPVYASDMCTNLPGMATTGDGECMCSIHYDGHICDVCDVQCGEHAQGRCHLDAKLDLETNSEVIGIVPECICTNGYSGPTCEVAPCGMNCFEGQCVESIENNGRLPYCECNDGWKGEFCTLKCPVRC